MPFVSDTAVSTLDIAALQRRTLHTLVVAKVFGGAGLAAGITVSALLAQDMLGKRGLAGVPSALFTVGSAAAAIGIGRLSNRAGRRPGLTAGYAAAAVGSLGVVAAAVLYNTALLFVALLIYGSGTATNLQARYAGADLAPAGHRARAIGSVLVATTVGAVIGPNLTGVLGDLAAALDIPRLAGPFLLAAFADGTAAIVIWTRLRPDPLLMAMGQKGSTTAEPSIPAGDGSERNWNPPVLIGVLVLTLTHTIMLATMAMTPVYLRNHHHGLGVTGLLMSIHVAAMYLPSPLAGILVDRWGSAKIGILAALVLVAAGTTASLASPTFLPALAVALCLWGIGWNLGLIAGSAIITDNAPLGARAKIQGTADVCIALAGATGGLTSGLVVAHAGYASLAGASLVLSLAIIPFLLGLMRLTSAPRPRSHRRPRAPI